MNHLSGMDASFLHLETPEMPMHVGSLQVLDLPPGYDGDYYEDVKRYMGERMHLQRRRQEAHRQHQSRDPDRLSVARRAVDHVRLRIVVRPLGACEPDAAARVDPDPRHRAQHDGAKLQRCARGWPDRLPARDARPGGPGRLRGTGAQAASRKSVKPVAPAPARRKALTA